MDRAQRLSGLREILTRRPGRHTWKRLSTLLVEAPAEDADFLVDYAQEHLVDWPEALRNSWHIPREELVRPQPPPFWRLVRHIGAFFPLDLLRHLCDIGATGRITILQFQRRQLDKKMIRTVLHRRHWANLHTLDLSANALDPGLLRALFYHEGPEQLKVLDLSCCQLHHEGLRTLVEAPSLRALESLILSHNSLGSAGMEMLSKARQWPGLRELALTDCGLSKKAARHFVQFPYLEQLEVLRLGSNLFTGNRSGMRRLAEALSNASCRELEVELVSQEGAALLARLPLMAQLEALKLPSVTGSGLRGFAQARDTLPSLEHLALEHCALGREEVEALSRLSLPSLRVLWLGGNFKMGAQALALDRMELPRLETLSLQNSRIGEGASNAWSLASKFGSLKTLDLEQNALTDRAFAYWLGAPFTQVLEELNLNGNELTDESVFALCKAPVMGTLKHLSMVANRLTAQGAKALVAAAMKSGMETLHLTRNEVSAQTAQDLSQQAEGSALVVEFGF